MNMTDELSLEEPKRVEVEIKPTNNALGKAVALFALAYNHAKENTGNISMVAFEVENDMRWGDHIVIKGRHRTGEEAGGFTTQEVIIHNAPMGYIRHTVRFVNFGQEEEVREYSSGSLNLMVMEVMNFILFGD